MQPLPRPDPALADLFLPDRAREIAFWTDLALGYGRVVVNWHCGGGELALGLAQSGLRVVGVDPEPGLIEVARARERNANTNSALMITWLANEPRLIQLPGPADFVLMSDNALGLYLNDEQRINVLTNAFHHLRPGGALGLSVPLIPGAGITHRTAISGPLRRLPPGIFARRVSDLQYDPAQRCLTFTDDVLVRLGTVEQHFEETGCRRLYTPVEIAGMLRSIGYIAIGMWGGWDRRAMRQAGASLIVRAERPVARMAGIADKPMHKAVEPLQKSDLLI